MPLHCPQGVGLHVFARHKPGRMFAAAFLCAAHLQAANAQALALTQRVKRQAYMLANGVAFGILNRTGLFGDVAVEEFTEWPLAYEANAR